ncbi:leucine carboxyl methyltransferase 1-like [Anneissia japonica]|uniref:leucine carboxyl methyltransferase 1-like n=1 Tax=Anneissia japonica TaxID=1529436 RepID=UPI001425A44E|nr:leucine carboxyl methyltransferase 1-like [Anneissia japonica]
MSDEAVQATNDDASMCKRYAVEKGYWKDPYINLLVKLGERRAPEISRGYYARMEGIRILLEKFLRMTECKGQVVSLGAGFDTALWRLKDAKLLPTSYIEVDFRPVTSRKCQKIRSRDKLMSPLIEISGGREHVLIGDAELHSKHYHIVWADLRNLEEFEDKLKSCGIDNSLPTLFLAECVLVYMSAAKSSELLSWISGKFDSVFFINYEQVNMQDRFGQVMVNNLRGRKCDLCGIEPCTSLKTQEERFTSSGWESSRAVDMMEFYQSLPDLDRIVRLEFLDEAELLEQLMTHYCICAAYKDPNNIGFSSINLKKS